MIKSLKAIIILLWCVKNLLSMEISKNFEPDSLYSIVIKFVSKKIVKNSYSEFELKSIDPDSQEKIMDYLYKNNSNFIWKLFFDKIKFIELEPFELYTNKAIDFEVSQDNQFLKILQFDVTDIFSTQTGKLINYSDALDLIKRPENRYKIRVKHYVGEYKIYFFDFISKKERFINYFSHNKYGRLLTCSISPDGKTLFFANHDHTIYIYDIKNDKLIGILNDSLNNLSVNYDTYRLHTIVKLSTNGKFMIIIAFQYRILYFIDVKFQDLIKILF